MLRHSKARTKQLHCLSAASLRIRRTSDLSFSLKSDRRFCCKCHVGLPDVASVTSAAYGLLLLGGGLFAYNKSRSKGLLFGGLTGSTLMAYFLMQAEGTKAIGNVLRFGLTFLFSTVFGRRWAATRKLTSAGPLFGLSICALAIFTSAYLEDSL